MAKRRGAPGRLAREQKKKDRLDRELDGYMATQREKVRLDRELADYMKRVPEDEVSTYEDDINEWADAPNVQTVSTEDYPWRRRDAVLPEDGAELAALRLQALEALEAEALADEDLFELVREPRTRDEDLFELVREPRTPELHPLKVPRIVLNDPLSAPRYGPFSPRELISFKEYAQGKLNKPDPSELALSDPMALRTFDEWSIAQYPNWDWALERPRRQGPPTPRTRHEEWNWALGFSMDDPYNRFYEKRPATSTGVLRTPTYACEFTEEGYPPNYIHNCGSAFGRYREDAHDASTREPPRPRYRHFTWTAPGHRNKRK
jgi:hypothetical protein